MAKKLVGVEMAREDFLVVLVNPASYVCDGCGKTIEKDAAGTLNYGMQITWPMFDIEYKICVQCFIGGIKAAVALGLEKAGK